MPVTTSRSTAKFNLHAHENQASADSDTPLRDMALAYADRGYDVVGFVGHDRRPDPPTDDLPVEVMTGIEHEVRTKPTRLHVVSYPDHDLSILAHPALTWESPSHATVDQAGRRLDVDAVELYSRGRRHLPEHSDAFHGSLPRVANDDAHSTNHIGASYMTADVGRPTPTSVVEAVKTGDVSLHNPGVGRTNYYAGRLLQGLALARQRLSR